MAGAWHQFSVRRLLALVVAWGIGLAAAFRLPGGLISVGCALIFGVSASVIFLGSYRRLLVIWFASWIFLTVAAAGVMIVSMAVQLPHIVAYAFIPTETISRELGWISSGCSGWVDAILYWPLITGIALSPSLAVVVEVIACSFQRWRSSPPRFEA